MEPRIIYEDNSIVVLDKPAGLQVIPGGTEERKTLEDWLKTKYKEFHIVHRLDRETSGVMVVAKTETAFEKLKEQFQKREIKKTYRAFVYGILKDERGVIDKPIGSARGGTSPRSAKKPYGQLREATTIYRTVRNGVETTYVEVFPQTGRTHQIRVHLSAIGHPVVCDKQYAPGRACILGFSRLALHALSLSFIHPESKKEMLFEASLPPDFVAAEQAL